LINWVLQPANFDWALLWINLVLGTLLNSTAEIEASGQRGIALDKAAKSKSIIDQWDEKLWTCICCYDAS
jgi:hypothetical protein